MPSDPGQPDVSRETTPSWWPPEPAEGWDDHLWWRSTSEQRRAELARWRFDDHMAEVYRGFTLGFQALGEALSRVFCPDPDAHRKAS